MDDIRGSKAIKVEPEPDAGQIPFLELHANRTRETILDINERIDRLTGYLSEKGVKFDSQLNDKSSEQSINNVFESLEHDYKILSAIDEKLTVLLNGLIKII